MPDFRKSSHRQDDRTSSSPPQAIASLPRATTARLRALAAGADNRRSAVAVLFPRRLGLARLGRPACRCSPWCAARPGLGGFTSAPGSADSAFYLAGDAVDARRRSAHVCHLDRPGDLLLAVFPPRPVSDSLPRSPHVLAAGADGAGRVDGPGVLSLDLHHRLRLVHARPHAARPFCR